MKSTVLALLLLFLAGATGYAIYSGRIAIPDEWNPWAPLQIEDPLNWLTRFKVARLSSNDTLCLQILGEAHMRYSRIPDRDTQSGCGYHNAVRVEATRMKVNEPFTLSCRGAVALALWEQHVVVPAARANFDESLAGLEHFGSYACRNVYGRKDAPLSRHASADALDVSGFVLENGRRIRVDRARLLL